MKNLETLIQELCPDGVEFVKIGEVAKVGTGSSNRQDAVDDGKYPFYVRSKNILASDTYEFDDESIIIPGEGGIGEIFHYVKGKYALHQRVYRINFYDERINVKFVYYYMYSCFKRFIMKKAVSATVTSIRKPMIEKFEFPLPPIEVQTEIVRILDKFTSLEAELEAELDCRKRQYEYYRDKLLSFDNVGGQEVEWKKMSEVCKNICSGGTPLTSKAEYYDGNIPWLRTQEVDYCEIHSTLRNITQLGLKNSSAKMIPANCVIVAMYGATAAKVAINKIPLCTNQACCNLEIDEKQALVRYVYQWICKQYEVLKAMGEGSQHNINAKKVKDFKIPIPTLEEQNRIVSILDRFESLTTSLQSGLPAEISARRQQYEYYRDKLLTFKRKGAA